MTIMNNVYHQSYKVNAQQRSNLKGHKPTLVFFTGLSGSGKSTISDALEQELNDKGIHTYSLDGDNLRLGLNKDLAFSEKDRNENLRRVAHISNLMLDAGLVVLAAFVAPLRSQREKIKDIVGATRVIEIHIATPLHVCEQRDVKGLYALARKGEIKNFTGIDAPYEIPLNPDLKIQTQNEELDTSVDKLVNLVLKKIKN